MDQYPQQPPQQPPNGWTPPPGQPQPPTWPGQHPHPMQPPPQKNTGKIIGFSCLGVLGGLVLLGILGALVSSGNDDDPKSKPPAASAPQTSKAAKDDDEPAEKAKEEPAASPIKVSATKTKFTPSVLHDGGAYTSVKVTVTNDSDETIDINPLDFSITDTGGAKHTEELGADENQMDTTKLAPGENITGVITGKGTFTPKYVTFGDGWSNDPIRGDVK